MEATGKILVVKAPPGDAPEEVRRAWVGLTLPAYPQFGKEVGYGSLSKDVVFEGDAFCVPAAKALEALRLKSPEAADWWGERGHPIPFTDFLFPIDCANVLEKSVKHRK